MVPEWPIPIFPASDKDNASSFQTFTILTRSHAKKGCIGKNVLSHFIILLLMKVFSLKVLKNIWDVLVKVLFWRKVSDNFSLIIFLGNISFLGTPCIKRIQIFISTKSDVL